MIERESHTKIVDKRKQVSSSQISQINIKKKSGTKFFDEIIVGDIDATIYK